MTDELRDHIREQVAGGVATRDEIAQSAFEVGCDGNDAKCSSNDVERITDELIQAHLKEQEAWPEVTDCDRLNQAFAELERAGIVCRQHFACCGSCGSAEIWGEIEATRALGREVVGYAFYDQQGTESAAQGCGLCLSYGSVLKGEGPALLIARQIVDTLSRHDLITKWDGSWDKRIDVKLDWKRRWAHE